MLLTRRNEALEELLRRELEGLRKGEGRTAVGGEEPVGGGKKRGRPPGKGKGKGKA